ncbi:hypothetical protein PR048_033457, partial [Dryococelus australis]
MQQPKGKRRRLRSLLIDIETVQPQEDPANQLATPLVDERTTINVAEYRNVSGVARTNRRKVSGNADPNASDITVGANVVSSLQPCLRCQKICAFLKRKKKKSINQLIKVTYMPTFVTHDRIIIITHRQYMSIECSFVARTPDVAPHTVLHKTTKREVDSRHLLLSPAVAIGWQLFGHAPLNCEPRAVEPSLLPTREILGALVATYYTKCTLPPLTQNGTNTDINFSYTKLPVGSDTNTYFHIRLLLAPQDVEVKRSGRPLRVGSSCASKVKKRGSDTGDTNPAFIAPHRPYARSVKYFRRDAVLSAGMKGRGNAGDTWGNRPGQQHRLTRFALVGGEQSSRWPLEFGEESQRVPGMSLNTTQLFDPEKHFQTCFGSIGPTRCLTCPGRTLAQSSRSTVTTDNQCAVDIDIFVHKALRGRRPVYAMLLAWSKAGVTIARRTRHDRPTRRSRLCNSRAAELEELIAVSKTMRTEYRATYERKLHALLFAGRGCGLWVISQAPRPVSKARQWRWEVGQTGIIGRAWCRGRETTGCSAKRTSPGHTHTHAHALTGTHAFESHAPGWRSETSLRVYNPFGVTSNFSESPAEVLIPERGKREIPRENPPINGIVRHGSHTRKSGVARPGIGTRIALVGSEQANRSATMGAHGGAAVRPFAVPGESCSMPGGVTPGFSHVGIVPDDTAGQPVFSGMSRFSHPFNSDAAPYFTSLASALKTSLMLHFTVLYVQDPASFSHWLLRRCKAMPFISEPHVIGAYNCKVFNNWRNVTQCVPDTAWANDIRIAKIYLVFEWLFSSKCRVGAVVSCFAGLYDSGITRPELIGMHELERRAQVPTSCHDHPPPPPVTHPWAAWQGGAEGSVLTTWLDTPPLHPPPAKTITGNRQTNRICLPGLTSRVRGYTTPALSRPVWRLLSYAAFTPNRDTDDEIGHTGLEMLKPDYLKNDYDNPKTCRIQRSSVIQHYTRILCVARLCGGLPTSILPSPQTDPLAAPSPGMIDSGNLAGVKSPPPPPPSPTEKPTSLEDAQECSGRSAAFREISERALLSSGWRFLQHIFKLKYTNNIYRSSVSLCRPTCAETREPRGHGGRAVSLFASHQGDPGLIPGRVTPACGNRAGQCRWSAGFLEDHPSPPQPSLSFQRCYMLASITLIGSQDLVVKSRQNLSAPLPQEQRFLLSAYFISWRSAFVRLIKLCYVLITKLLYNVETVFCAQDGSACPRNTGSHSRSDLILIVESVPSIYVRTPRRVKYRTDRGCSGRFSDQGVWSVALTRSGSVWLAPQGATCLLIAGWPLVREWHKGPLFWRVIFTFGRLAVYYGGGALATVLEKGLKRGENKSARECKVWGNGRSPRKPRRPAASSGTSPTCENPRMTRTEIDPGSPWRRASGLTAQPLRPPTCHTLSVFSKVTVIRFLVMMLHRVRLHSPIHTRADIIIYPLGPRWCSGQTTRLPPGRTGFASRWGRPRGFRKWESRRTMPLPGRFSRVSPVPPPPPLNSGAAPYSPRFNSVSSRTNPSTQLIYRLASATVGTPSLVTRGHPETKPFDSLFLNDCKLIKNPEGKGVTKIFTG